MKDKVKRPPKIFLSRAICKGLCLLSDEQAGRVIREACAAHICAEIDAHLPPEAEANIIWQMLQSELVDNESEYRHKCEQNRMNQLRRWAKDSEEVEEEVVELKPLPSTQRRKAIRFDRVRWVYEFIPEDDIEGWKQSYPGVDVEEQIVRAQQWQKDNPKHVKKDHRRFLGAWLARAYKDVEASGLIKPQPRQVETRNLVEGVD